MKVEGSRYTPLKISIIFYLLDFAAKSLASRFSCKIAHRGSVIQLVEKTLASNAIIMGKANVRMEEILAIRATIHTIPIAEIVAIETRVVLEKD